MVAATLKTFEEAMDDDLNISAALAAQFELIRDLNKLADNKEILAEDLPVIQQAIRKMDQVFGDCGISSG